MSSEVRIVIEKVPEPPRVTERVRAALADNHQVAARLDGADPSRLIVTADVLGDHDDEPGAQTTAQAGAAPFRATVFDPVANRGIELRGHLDRPEEAEVRSSTRRPLPTSAEVEAAVRTLRTDARFPADAIVYRSMPPLADVERPDGSRARRLTLGIYRPSGTPRHRIVAVDIAAGEVDWEPAGVAAHTDGDHGDCEERLPAEVLPLRDRGGPAMVRMRVISGGEELWNLVVVRPRDSAPAGNGSGVELRQVRYRGRLVLRRAHVPILNVRYDDGTTFRDWQNTETRFRAVGQDPVGWGWRVCDRPPQTILESGTDAGAFQGVAFYYDDDDGEVRIVSELEAGWYRYVSDWRLALDGTIKPRFGFGAIKNPMTCQRHHHHAYWRFDFDIGGSRADVVEQGHAVSGVGDEGWAPITRETKRRRGAAARHWRVRDKSSGYGYRIVPGEHDGTADAFGISDLWFLRNHPDELTDDPLMDDRAHLDAFLNGEDIAATDVVVWYGGHFVHDQHHDPQPHQGHIVGPDLIPMVW
ncbi:hypothetical protein [Sphaerisporangium perillae]|uniref:hypothetical protein n=1 Tax=Sphaerisporangium perillae TaxID=2935860 RepID=UPI0020104F55|nr:hypothetical protein [Sphaerisporangium perillae]